MGRDKADGSKADGRRLQGKITLGIDVLINSIKNQGKAAKS
ncbi:hypothetical protein [Coleofasciculus sp. F4-SAH-05]